MIISLEQKVDNIFTYICIYEVCLIDQLNMCEVVVTIVSCEAYV